MDFHLDDTIAALASAPGGAARGILRISGPATAAALDTLIPDFASSPLAQVRRAASAALNVRVPSVRVPIPGRLYWWPTKRSYTGEPLAELHLPGSTPLLEAVLGDLLQGGTGVRGARPGEFTLRAFLAGRMDLLQAEAVLGVIDAHDHRELETALSQLAGGLSGRLAQLRHDVVELLADLEAGLDFVEEDIEFVSRAELTARVAVARHVVESLCKQAADRLQSRWRPRVVLAGLPNAGKSSLFNVLCGTDAAIVSPIEGTTRDFLVRPVSWRGLDFDLVDTAGWEATQEGIAAAAQWQRADQTRRADLVLWCTAADLPADQRDAEEQLWLVLADGPAPAIRLLTKSDLTAKRLPIPEMLPVSVQDALGLEQLASRMTRELTSSAARGPQWLGMTAARCRETLAATAAALERAEDVAGQPAAGDELLAVELRDALDGLGQILGVVYTDDLLGRIFSKFCIGK